MPIIVFATLAAPAQTGARSQINRLAGEWEVTAVSAASNATRKLLYANNDPRLLHRLLQFSPIEIVAGFPESAKCSGPQLSPMPGNDAVAARSHLLAARLETRPELLEIRCRQGDLGPESATGRANWIAIFPDGRLALRWYDDAVLTLARSDPRQPPVPSFSCSAARKASEIAICKSRMLASLDRSLAEAFALARRSQMESDGETAAAELRKAQQAWIAQRDECGSEVGCLREAIARRLGDLMSLVNQ